MTNAIKIAIAKLKAATTVTTIVQQKINPIAPPQGTALPMVVLHMVVTIDEPTLNGAGKYYRSRIQADCMAATSSAAIDLGDAVIETLNGVIKEDVAGATDVDILLESTDFSEYDEQSTSFRRVIQFSVRFRGA